MGRKPNTRPKKPSVRPRRAGGRERRGFQNLEGKEYRPFRSGVGPDFRLQIRLWSVFEKRLRRPKTHRGAWLHVAIRNRSFCFNR
jgi:hypothetical protein